MVEAKPRNEHRDPVTRFCLALEELRRTEAGRVRTARDMLTHFFPHDPSVATDRIFLHLPPEVRAPVVSAWGIRGAKAAVRDDDEKIRVVVHDALLAGDLDDASFEEGLSPELVVGWVPLPDWWSFWRGGLVGPGPTSRALDAARGLGLFDDRWFLENVAARGGKLVGTDAICDTLGKDQIVAWLARLREVGDGSPAGVVAALGWDVILAKTAHDALLAALDALAVKIGLVARPTQPESGRTAEPPPLTGPDPSWPELAQPGDMGHALAKGISLAPGENVKPTYHFDEDDERPTSEIYMGGPGGPDGVEVVPVGRPRTE